MCLRVSRVLSSFEPRKSIPNIETKLITEWTSQVCKTVESEKRNQHLQQQSIVKQNENPFEMTQLEIAFHLE